MTSILSLLGFQPSAVAVAVRTWVQRVGPVNRLVLLATNQTAVVADRLTEWADKEGTPCQVYSISGQLDGRGELPSAPDLVRKLLTESPKDDLVFLGEPGPKFLVVATARVLPAATVFVHTDDRFMHVKKTLGDKEQWREFPLVNLGFGPLLSLYGLNTRPARRDPLLETTLRRTGANLPRHVRRNIRFAHTDLPPMALAYERGGRLYALFTVSHNNHLQGARAIARMHQELNGLQPFRAVLSDSDRALFRARAEKLFPMNANTRQGRTRLADWVQGRVPPAGSVTLEVGGKTIPAKPVVGSLTGGDNSALVVCLGNQPTPTLISLVTHKPARAYVLYDSKTPEVLHMALRLYEIVRYLPVGETRFVEADRLGRNIRDSLAGLLRGERQVRINITPGTKAQGCALASVAGASLWSLHSQKGQAVSLSGSEAPIPLQAPPLEFCARLNGGTLEDSGVPADEYPAEVATFLFHYARFILHFINCLKGQPSNLDKVVSRACPHGDIKAGPTRGGFTDVSVSYQNRVLAARVVSRGGQWLEEVATVALREAGANELFSGVVWGWPTQVLDRFEDHGVGRNRSEVDVLARMGYRYLAVECKAGSSQTLAAASKGIEAVALAGLGRFGIPVVLRPVIPRQLIEASLKSKSRAVLLDLRTLLDTAELKKILSSVFANRSTFQSDD